ncbi:hypothetical protein AB4Y35_18375 [Paraburkholderia sp. EG286A]|uniref:hypothetical protein n=1 Tax=Paraburkholderia sp. EG286A TaxID=3237014 RepID=UPI0034D1B5EA
MKRQAGGQDDLADRPIREYKLPLEVGDKVHSVENVVIRFGDTGLTRDFGSFCYLERESRAIRAKGKPTKVVLASFVPSRRRFMAKFIYWLSEGIRQGLSQRGQYLCSQILFSFIAWADANLDSDALASAETIAVALVGYTDYLTHEVRTGRIAKDTAGGKQARLISCLRYLTGAEHLADGLTHLRRGDGENGTVPRSEKDIGQQLAIDLLLFEGLRTLVLQEESLPFALRVPPFVQQPYNVIWIFPTRGLFRTAAEINSSAMQNGYGQFAYDFENGRLRTYQECKSLYESKSVAKAVIHKARILVGKANENKRSGPRISIAKVAMNSFVDMFLANAGMDWEQVRTLQWEGDDFTVERLTQDFSAVKNRAKGVVVTFTITNVFLPRFRLYLSLRNWVLNGKKCDLLFFRPVGICADGGFRIEPLPLASLDLLHVHRRLAPNLVVVGSREWRSTKTNWNVDRYGTAAAAAIAQNSRAVVETKYSAGTETNAIKESGEFLSRLSAKFVSRKHADTKHTSPVGGCNNINHPTPALADPPVNPDCHQPEGCLFCAEHTIVADEIDIRKLLSLRYCILHTRPFSSSKEHWKDLFRPVLARIKDLLNRIAAKSERHRLLVARVRVEVDKYGKLDPYWEAKMAMLDEISGDVTW